MPSTTEITVSQLSRLVGVPDAPALVDVRDEDDYAADPRLIPGARRHDHRAIRSWVSQYRGRTVVVVCQKGLKLSQGTAAWLRHEGIAAQSLAGGYAAWRDADQMLLTPARLPKTDPDGRTVWVTRARPKVDRIACPWLIRRFVDPRAVFLYVAPSEVAAVAERFEATPFDIAGVFWSHRGEGCTFDTMLSELGLKSEPLDRLAAVIRGADTDRLALTPQSAGVLAALLGYSRLFKDDLAQLDAAMTLLDALYRWSRDAFAERHDWEATGGARADHA
jgi:rhodanese-related sulfurtransferase